MKSWSARLAGLAVVLCVAVGVSGQDFFDPNDPLYRQLDDWQVRGLIGGLPQLRPYPLQVVIGCLDAVAASPKATAVDRRRVADLRSAYGSGLHVGLEAVGRLRGTGDGGGGNPDSYLHAQPRADMQGMVTEWLGVGADFRLYLVDAPAGALAPAAERPRDDFIADWTDVDLGGRNLQVRQMMNGLTSLGTVGGDIFAQAGFVRNSIGPFADNGIIVGPQAPVAGHFSVLLRRPEAEFVQAVLPLVATKDDGTGMSSQKLFYYHDLTVHILPGFDLSVFETILSGRIDLLYFIPVASFFHLQGLSGFSDNSLLGFTTRIHPVDGVDLKGVLYLDDLHFNDIARLNFNTKWKLAWQAGVALAPPALVRGIAAAAGLASDADDALLAWFPRVTFDYTAVMPYMYTHVNTGGTAYNVENNTHWGVNLGAALEPNSDRWELNLGFVPFDLSDAGRLDLGLMGKLLRHGNASAGVIPGGDGSIYDPGLLHGQPTYQPPFIDPTGQPYTRFLTQAVIERTLQLGLALDWRVGQGSNGGAGRGWGDVALHAAYTFEYAWDAGLVAGAEASRHFLELGLRYRY